MKTLDIARSNFEANQNARTAADYLEQATQYHHNGMIADGTLYAIISEVIQCLRLA